MQLFEFVTVGSTASWHVLCCLTHFLMGDSIVGLVQYNIDRDQKKPVSTILIRGNEITQKMCACSLISSNSRSECQWKTRWVIPNRLTSTIRISHYELICSCSEWSCFCRKRFAFAVSDLLQCCERIAFPVSDLLLPWELTHSKNVHACKREQKEIL